MFSGPARSAPVYVDHNAGSPLRPEARAAMLEALDVGGNASSIHGVGRAARRLVEGAREVVADACGVTPAQVIFTSGGTEANALALHGHRVLASAVEHAAVLDQPSVSARRLAVGAQGQIKIDDLAEALDQTKADVVAVMAANNETGVVQPIAAVGEALSSGIRLHVDAVQAPGRLDLKALAGAADSLALSAHKCGGPAGVGALIVGHDIEIQPLLRGGGQERGSRCGTENLAGIVGMAAALAATVEPAKASAENERLGRLQERLESALGDRVQIAGARSNRLPTTTCLVIGDRRGEAVVMALDLRGIAVSSGAACSSGRVRQSHVLAAMGYPDDIQGNGVRVSFGWTTVEAHIDRCIEAFDAVLARPGRHTALVSGRAG